MDNKLYIPLQFWFHSPLIIAQNYHDIKLNLKFKTVDELLIEREPELTIDDIDKIIIRI